MEMDVLTSEEAKAMKEIRFKLMQAQLVEIYKKCAFREVAQIGNQISGKILAGSMQIGPEKVLIENIVKQNIKEYKAFIKASASPDRRFREYIGDEMPIESKFYKDVVPASQLPSQGLQ